MKLFEILIAVICIKQKTAITQNLLSMDVKKRQNE